MNTGEKIYDLRTQKGLTLEELGNMVGVGKSTVRKWENGMIANMKRDKIIAVAKALGTTPAYLMGWEDDTEDVSYKESPSAPSTPEILTLYNSLDAEDQSLALGIVRQMAEQDKYKKYKKELSAG